MNLFDPTQQSAEWLPLLIFAVPRLFTHQEDCGMGAAFPKDDRFGRFAAQSSHYLGSRWAFVSAIGIILVWAVSGPIFHFSDTWQLVINTGTRT